MNAPQRIRVPLLEKVALLMLAQRHQATEEAVLVRLIREAALRELTLSEMEERTIGEAKDE